MTSSDGCLPANNSQRINQFALVSYIPHPLGKFLDDLRLNLVPDCKPRAHVTILPPRPLCGETEEAIGKIRTLADDFGPFEVRLGAVHKFPVSEVIYLELVSGKEELKAMYRAMNCGHCSYREPFSYHPHITLAQNLGPCEVESALNRASTAWESYPQQRSFRVEVLSFVQNTTECRWLDLSEIFLPKHVLAR